MVSICVADVEVSREPLPACLWKENPNRLVSLLDMVRIYAANFVRIGARFERCHTDPRSLAIPDENISEQMQERFDDLVNTLRLDAKDFCLEHTPEFTEAFAEKARKGLTYRDLSTATENIHRIYQSELRKRLFLSLSSERSKYFENLDRLTEQASKAFPSCVPEIRDAGNCYALEQDTASVMHSMRALESPLLALARDFGVSIGRDQWHAIIKNIETKVGELSNTSGSDWRERQEFYAPACKEFRYFKDAWRNYAMHGKIRFDGPEAKRILDHAVAFIEHLGVRLREVQL